MELPKEVFEALAGKPADEVWNTASLPVSGRYYSGKLFGLMGVWLETPGKDVGTQPEKESAQLHVMIRLGFDETAPSEPTRGSKEWAALAEQIAKLVPELSWQCVLNLWLPVDEKRDDSWVIDLPINLGDGAVPGFNSIGGVRLVQKDEEGADRELYSVVLDRQRKGTSIQANVPLSAPLSSGLLERAFAASWTVARLSVTSLGDTP
jgi:hypothetical protein